LREWTDMNNAKPRNFLLIGLPSTGKTSFLAALWYAIQQNQTPTGLILEKLEGNSTYLNTIRADWLAFKAVGRNPTDSETYVSMSLKKRQGNEQVSLTFPDVSGESFKQQWASRQLTVSYEKCLKVADGGILFIHPKSIIQPLRITEVDDLASLIDDEVAAEAAEPATAAPPATPWDIERAPTQVQLVELLQFLKRQPHFRPPFRLAIAISAWDLVLASKMNPENWVQEQLPLLSQFINSNRSLFECAFYGISAQGGNYEGIQAAELHSKNPAKRIEIFGEGIKNKHDITEPLQWLMR
jgi:hypothetical protein